VLRSFAQRDPIERPHRVEAVAGERETQVVRAGSRLDADRGQPGHAVVVDRRRKWQACHHLSIASVKPDLEFTRRRRGRMQVDRVAVLAELEIEWKLANRCIERGTARQVGAAPQPAQVHDVDEKSRSLTLHRCIIFEVQHDALVGAGFQLLARAHVVRHRFGRLEFSRGIAQSELTVPSGRERQAAAEVAVVDALTRRPAEFRDGRGARPGHPLDTLLRRMCSVQTFAWMPMTCGICSVVRPVT
jgi:hypothetical protein